MRNLLHTLLCCLTTCLVLGQGLEFRLPIKDAIKILPHPSHSILLLNNNGKSQLYNGSTTSTPSKDHNLLYADKEISIHFMDQTIRVKRLSDKKETTIGKNLLISQIRKIQRLENELLIAYAMDLWKVDLNDFTKTTIIENNLYNSSNMSCADVCVLALGKLLLNPLTISEVIYSAEHTIDKIVVNPDRGILYLSNNNLWIHAEGKSKIISPAEGQIPSKPIDLKSTKRYLYLVTDNEVHVFDWLTSSIDKVGSFYGNYYTSMSDDWGCLWITTSEGIWNYTPGSVKEKAYLNIKKIEDDQSMSYSKQGISLKPEVNHIHLESELVYLPNKMTLETEWSLDGNDWKKFNKDLIIPASMFNVGDNQLFFRVIVDQIKKFSIEHKLNVSKSKNSKNILAWILFPLLALLSLISLISLRNSRKEREKMKIEISKIRAESQLIQTELKNDQLKMNPHFLFNALASVNGLLAQQKIPEARRAINSFSKFLREFLYSSDNDEISLEAECSLLENYLKIEKICRGNSFDYKIEKIDDELLENVVIPNMILQPFVENAIVHGVSTVEHQGLIKLRFYLEDSFLIAEVEDNGPGFAPAKPNKEHKSMAINLIKKRLHRLGVGSRKEYVEYENINPGTRVKVYLRKF